MSTISSYLTNCVQGGGDQKCTPTTTKSKKCAVDKNFWIAIDKMVMICFPTSLLGDQTWISCTNAELKQVSAVASTITADLYWEMLTKPRSQIQKYHCGKVSSGVIFLDNNARAHITPVTKKKIQESRWILFDHSPCSPEHEPSLLLLAFETVVWSATV